MRAGRQSPKFMSPEGQEYLLSIHAGSEENDLLECLK